MIKDKVKPPYININYRNVTGEVDYRGSAWITCANRL
jgi:hypothetical protein